MLSERPLMALALLLQLSFFKEAEGSEFISECRELVIF